MFRRKKGDARSEPCDKLVVNGKENDRSLLPIFICRNITANTDK